jgi:hypothetical protein
MKWKRSRKAQQESKSKGSGSSSGSSSEDKHSHERSSSSSSSSVAQNQRNGHNSEKAGTNLSNGSYNFPKNIDSLSQHTILPQQHQRIAALSSKEANEESNYASNLINRVQPNVYHEREEDMERIWRVV